jgi:hypothetical protein
MCALLKLQLHAAARGNHKAVSVERFFRVLNRSVAIACNDRGTNQVFVEAVHCTAYDWNASPIDGTDIIRSVAAVGREFKSPFDLTLSTEPQPSSTAPSPPFMSSFVLPSLIPDFHPKS